LTDQGNAYRSRTWAQTADQLGIGRRLTRPYRPQTNGKAERMIRTLTQEWAYVRLYDNNATRLAALAGWLDFYNRRRPHTALRGRSPADLLVNNGRGNYI
jgi:transposase InsO family protein